MDHGEHREHGEKQETVPVPTLRELRGLRGDESRPDFAAMRSRLAATDGPAFWRSLEELAGTPEFEEMLHREFPAHASEWTDGDALSRRRFLKLMGASLALAGFGWGASGCTKQPQEKILPYVRQPELLTPGVPLQFATAMPHFHGFSRGVLVESHEGRPTKIEGNPEHPACRGATDVFTQAAILDLYDPDRARNVLRAGEISTWDLFFAELQPLLAAQEAKGGAGLRILTEPVVSPTLGAQLDALLKKYPRAKWHQYEAISRDNVCEGAQMAFGEFVETHHDFSKAKVVLSLDSDFLFDHPDSLRYARQFADARRVAVAENPDTATMNRLYVVEPTPTITGSMADHRLPLAASEIAAFAQHLLALSSGVVNHRVSGHYAARLIAIAADLDVARGASIVIASERQSAEVHALVHAMNSALGNVGQTVFYAPSTAVHPTQTRDSLRELVSDLQAGAVELLVVLGGNPVYHAPADFRFADAIKKAGRVLRHSERYDETSLYAHWHLPAAHFLETWSDGRAFDGTLSITQPLIEPLYRDARGAHEFLEALLTAPARQSYDIVRDHWRADRGALSDDNFNKWWRRAVHDGFVADSAFPRRSVSLQTTSASTPAPAEKPSGLELVFAPDSTVYDGRFANNGWLQETPKAITKLVWDNAALVSPKLAERLGLRNEDVVELKLADRALHAPVWILPGQAENSVTLHLGYGRTSAGHIGTGQGSNAFLLRTADAPGFAGGLEIKRIAGQRWELATTQQHHALDGRSVVRTATLADFLKDHAAPTRREEPEPGKDDTLYPDDHTYPVHAWAMAIDLNTCIGCNACTVACQAENNIPIVGKGQVRAGREMHWIRIDSYFTGTSLDQPDFVHQPVPCMHCENAPCEVVCPVAATVHDPDGLNEMIYNRCVGTRYCSNNCPYKVRRFNFFQWADQHTLTFKLQRNPEVTVRSRGVMEKCTYCIQRISRVKIDAERANRRPRDGEIVTACQQACPTEAIVFGDLNDKASRVSKIKRSPLNYGMLAELNTRPRTTYLAKLRNPNPAIIT